jgi:hypothetical protein
MADTKVNELQEKESQRAGAARRGLSINDTIAADANLSVGARGTDTSGVRAGAGAGAGGASVTPASPGESPAPNVVPNPGGSGTTPLSTGAVNQAGGPPDLAGDSAHPSREEIAAQAYQCWHERGCPEGSPEEDWYRAERELRERRQREKSVPAVA